ncbi:endosialin [Talpa occidentalis]|uniref:endosialin n=1 Tax=Talpa occidentalis TaxID=50954 RepID=UPI00189024CD|nr:endosialin [Talpa occidentalis]
MLLRLLLAWAAAVPTLGQGPWASEPHATCGPASCYALFLRRNTFLEAWRACRELGGDLATPRTPEEAQRVDSLVETSSASGLLWIGLQRQPRQCQPQRPLRGFMWTTGDQDTAFTNWAQPATAGPCPAQRCAALEASGEHRWLEGSCTLPVDGYLCQFSFEGACPALPGEASQTGPAVYTTPFHLVSTELQWLPLGSMGAVKCQAGGEASLLCMKQPEGGAVWSQAGPLCPSACDLDNGSCEQECAAAWDGRASCRCAEGFWLAEDGRGCEDACTHAPCEQQCEPGGPQGYSCHCRLGFRPSEDEPHRCVDTDECQIPGVCQQMCVNYIGGFECYCSEGHELEADGVNCRPAGAVGAPASRGLGHQLEDEEGEENEEDERDEEDEGDEEDERDEEDEEHSPDYGLAYGPGSPETREQLMSFLHPTGPPLLSAPRDPYRSAVLSATRPTWPSALLPFPARARDAALPADRRRSMSPTSAPYLPAARPRPVTSTRHPEMSPARPSPMFPDTQAADTQTATHLSPPPANHTPLASTYPARQPPGTPDLKAWASPFPIASTVQQPLATPSRPPRFPVHQVPLPAVTQPQVLHTLLSSHSPTHQASPTSPTHAPPKVPQAPREGAPEPTLAPHLAPAAGPTAAPTALGEASPAGRSRRDDRWLLVALLVPTCVFLVVLLALGIVYCTRCGPHAPNKRVTDCYRWVTHTGSKGSTEPVPHRGSLTGVQTCRTSV